MSRRARKLTEAWLTIASSAALPWGAWAMGQAEIRAVVVQSVIAGLLAAKAAFSEAPPHAQRPQN